MKEVFFPTLNAQDAASMKDNIHSESRLVNENAVSKGIDGDGAPLVVLYFENRKNKN